MFSSDEQWLHSRTAHHLSICPCSNPLRRSLNIFSLGLVGTRIEEFINEFTGPFPINGREQAKALKQKIKS